MKIFIPTIFSILVIHLTHAQAFFKFEDASHLYLIAKDSTLNDGSYDCTLQRISVYAKGSKKLVQVITPPGNTFFCGTPPDDFFQLEDVNFDGQNDFQIVQFPPAGPNIPYFYWIFNPATNRFQRDTALEEITSPDFDKTKKLITSEWRDGCCSYGKSTYQYINGKIALIEQDEVAEDVDQSGKRITTKKKLVNGELRVIDRKVERI